MRSKDRRFQLTILFLFFFIFPGMSLQSQDIPEFLIMTEEWKPYNYMNRDTLEGISVEILDRILRASGSRQNRADFELYPWARAYKTIQEQRNTILFTMLRTEARENMFKWVGPIQVINFNIYGLRSRNLKISSIDDLAQYTFVTMKDDASEELLREKGKLNDDHFFRANSNQHVAQLLASGRYDMILTSDIIAKSLAGYLGEDPEIFEPLMTFDTQKLYFAFHIKTDDSLIRLFQESLDDMKKEGIVDHIINKYYD